jgi:hypothetical protein
MRRVIGWTLLAIVWAGVGLRWAYPADLHGGYTGVLGFAIQCIDLVLIMPSWFLLQAIVAPPKVPWAYMAGTVVWILGISVLIFVLLIRKKLRDGMSATRKALS